MKTRKGNVTAIPLILIITLTLAISALASYKVLDAVDDATTNSTINQEALNQGKKAILVFDIGVILVNVSFYVASFIFVYRIRSNPIYAFPSLLFLAIGVWLSAELANVYNIIGGVDVLQPVANQFSSMTLFMKQLPVITAVLGSVTVILLYGKTRQGREVAA